MSILHGADFLLEFLAYKAISIYIKMYSPFVRVCPCARKSPKVLHRWRWNLDTTLQANTHVFRFKVYIYIYIYIYEKKCF
jgi:hypothetical protein